MKVRPYTSRLAEITYKAINRRFLSPHLLTRSRMSRKDVLDQVPCCKNQGGTSEAVRETGYANAIS